jgi:hypothetical protein
MAESRSREWEEIERVGDTRVYVCAESSAQWDGENTIYSESEKNMNDLIKYVAIRFCSYCGNDNDLDVIHDNCDNFHVKCQHCGAAGPIARTNAGAILLWNAPADRIDRIYESLDKLETLIRKENDNE